MTTLPAEQWSAYGSNRTFRRDVVRETDEEAGAKANRAKAGVSILKAKLAELRPDVLVIFGDDQKEGFDFSNFPALMVYVGEDFARGAYGQRGRPELYTTTPGHPGPAVHILTTLLSNGFDPAFSMTVPKPDEGMCHAVMRPLEYFDAYAIPTVPILFNSYYPPQSPAKRHYEIGRTVRVHFSSRRCWPSIWLATLSTLAGVRDDFNSPRGFARRLAEEPSQARASGSAATLDAVAQ